MKKLFFTLCLATSAMVNAQQTVSIGTTTTKANAVLWLKANGNQGLLLPAVANRSTFNLASPDDAGMMVFDLSDNKMYYWNGAAWVEMGSGSGAGESDGVIGNEVAKVNIARGGLELTGAGTAGDQLTVGLIEGTADGQILKWDHASKRWFLGTDNTGTAPTVDNTSIGLNGSSQLEVRNLGISTVKLQDGSVTDAKVSAGISGSKITPNFGSQAISTTGSLSVTGATTFNTRAYTWPSTAASANTFLRNDGSGNLTWQTIASSVDQTSQTGVLTGNGTAISGITASAGSQYFRRNSANTAFEFGTLAAADIPNLDASKVTTGTFPISRIAGAGAGARAILGVDDNNLSWVTGAPNQFLGTNATGELNFFDKSDLSFTTTNVIPKGSATGLTSSNIFDNGNRIGIGNTAPDASVTIGTPLGSGWVIPAATVGGASGGVFEAGNTNFKLSMESGSVFNRSIIASSATPGYGNGVLELKANFVSVNTPAIIDTNSPFGVTVGTQGGMYINSTNGTGGMPHYGYALNGVSRAHTYFHGPSGQWRVNNNGDHFRINSNGQIALGATTPFHDTYTYLNADLNSNPNLKMVTIAPIDNYEDNNPGILEIAGSGDENSDEIGVINFTHIASNNVGYNFARISAHREDTNPTYASLRFYTRKFATMSERMQINEDGLVGIGRTPVTNRLEVEGEASKTTASGWVANSDRRIKTEIQEIPEGIATIKKLRPVRFKYTDEWKRLHPSIEDKFYYNFIAQEFRQVFPDAVKGSGEFLEGDASEILQIDTYNAQIVAVKAIQELAERTERLEKENAELRMKLASLEQEHRKSTPTPENVNTQITALQQELKLLKELLLADVSKKD